MTSSTILSGFSKGTKASTGLCAAPVLERSLEVSHRQLQILSISCSDHEVELGFLRGGQGTGNSGPCCKRGVAALAFSVPGISLDHVRGQHVHFDRRNIHRHGIEHDNRTAYDLLHWHRSHTVAQWRERELWDRPTTLAMLFEQQQCAWEP